MARDEVLLSMLVEPKWVAEEKERGREWAREEGERPWLMPVHWGQEDQPWRS